MEETGSNTSLNTTPSPRADDDTDTAKYCHKFRPIARTILGDDGREYERPKLGYVGIIASMILRSPHRRLLLSEMYELVEREYPYFRYQECTTSWRNSIRHNLSLNTCFVKTIQRSMVGKGHYWTIHPACMDDFIRGDFSRRTARRKSKRGSFLKIGDDAVPHSTTPARTWYQQVPPPMGLLAVTPNQHAHQQQQRQGQYVNMPAWNYINRLRVDSYNHNMTSESFNIHDWNQSSIATPFGHQPSATSNSGLVAGNFNGLDNTYRGMPSSLFKGYS